MKHRWEPVRAHHDRCTRCGLERRTVLDPRTRPGLGWRTTVWSWKAPATGEVFTRDGGLTPTCPPSADGVVPREGRA